jgi:hypothetical protein
MRDSRQSTDKRGGAGNLLTPEPHLAEQSKSVTVKAKHNATTARNDRDGIVVALAVSQRPSVSRGERYLDRSAA